MEYDNKTIRINVHDAIEVKVVLKAHRHVRVVPRAGSVDVRVSKAALLEALAEYHPSTVFDTAVDYDEDVVYFYGPHQY